MKLAETLRQVDYDALDISDYSRNYIKLLLPSLDYYLDICSRALDLLSPTILVDYGGGHGFMSLLAKARGIQHVIYVDYNPEAAKTVSALSRLIGFGPDTILTGDQETLKEWSDQHNIVPDALVGIDVIEHIYRLKPFFSTLYTLNPQLDMVFTTASTPYNPWVKRRLERIMKNDELGYGDNPGFFDQRMNYIKGKRTDFSFGEPLLWAIATRGYTYADIDSALLSPLDDIQPPYPYPNTCDPATGSWTERILTLEKYQDIAAPRHVTLLNGFYNCHQKGLKGLAARLLNRLLRLSKTRRLAPFIILKFE